MSGFRIFDQRTDDVIFVGSWALDLDYPSLPGQKPKQVLICPNPPPRSYLLGGHRYLLKEPAGRSVQQIWTEVIAYRLGRLARVPVPPAFLACDEATGSTGVLIEFFYGYGDLADTRFVHARDLFQASRLPFNAERGSLSDNIRLSRMHAAPDARSWWAQAVAFDTLIGNTDRHTQNWGFLVQQAPGAQRLAHSLTPLFDNGSSLGAIVRDADLAQRQQGARFAQFISNGKHHYGWTSPDEESARFENLCGRFVARHGDIAPTVARIASVSDSQIEAVVGECALADFPVRFTEARAEFVVRQIKARRQLLVRSLGG